MRFYKNQIFYFYLFSILLVLSLFFAHLKLREYSYRDKELLSILTVLQDSSKTNNRILHEQLAANIEPQLACASNEKINWVEYFKSNSSAYPSNVISRTFSSLLKFDVRLIRMEPVGKMIKCELLVKDKNQFTVTVVFVRKGDKFLLCNIENLCALYQRLSCYISYTDSYRRTEQ